MLGPAAGGISVVVAGPAGGDAAARTLAALAAQTAADDRFEVILVAPPGAIERAALDHSGALRPGMRTRVVGADPGGGGSEGELRNLGQAAASHPFVTVIATGDVVGPAFVDALARAAEDTVVAAVAVIDPGGRAHGGEPTADVDGELRFVDPQLEPDVLATSDGRAYATALAREVGFSPTLSAGLGPDFAVRYWLRRDVRVAVIAAGAGASYVRQAPQALTSALVDRRAVNDQIALAAALGALIPGPPTDAARVIDHHQRVAAGVVNRYLHRNPTEHRSILDEILRIGAEHFPYDAMNANLAETLVVSFCFPPVADTSGMVVAKRVREYGEIVDVISNNENTAAVTFDEGAVRIAEQYVDQHVAVKAPRTFTASWSAITTFAELTLAAALDREAAHGRYRRVRSRAMWIAAHVPAAQLRARRPDLHWSAEMSDPLSRDVRGHLREAPLPAGDPVVIELCDAARERGCPVPATDHLGVFVEHVTYALADEIVFTNEHQRAYMLGYCPVPALAQRAEQISIIRPQPTLPARYYELETTRLDGHRLGPDRVRLAYFGNLYANRSLEDAVGALADLSAPERADVALAVFTSTPDLVREQVGDLGLSDVVDVQPYVPYLQFLNVLRHFDCLVIEDVTTTGTAHDLNPYLPSKWADYRGSGTPVWGIVEAGSPLSREALDYRSARGDRRAALATLRRIVLDRRQEAVGAGGRAPK